MWATIDIHDRPTLRLLTAVLQSPLVVLAAEPANGPRRRFRLVPSLARAGFLLSPLVDTTQGFARLAAARPDPTGLSQVQRLAISIEPGSLKYMVEPLVDVAFFRLQKFAPLASARRRPREPGGVTGLVTLLQGLQPPDPIGGAALISTDEGREAVNAHAPARFSRAAAAGGAAARVCVRAARRGADVHQRRRLPPHRRARRRLGGPLRAPAGAAPATRRRRPATHHGGAPSRRPYAALRVETLDNGDIACDWAYIAALRIE